MNAFSRATGPCIIASSKRESVTIPGGIADLESFRRWTRSLAFPRHSNIAYLAGEIWVDVAMETADHNKLAVKIAAVLTFLVEETNRGHIFAEEMRLTNVPAHLSSEPDVLFVSTESLDEGRVILLDGGAALEVEGSPDAVVEIVSPTSEEKDTKLLRKLYWAAGIQEYWLIELTKTGVKFELLQRGGKGYTAARPKDGWVKSSVFGRSFKLTRDIDQHGLSRFTLEVK